MDSPLLNYVYTIISMNMVYKKKRFVKMYSVIVLSLATYNTCNSVYKINHVSV